jgi:hypothetical protein
MFGMGLNLGFGDSARSAGGGGPTEAELVANAGLLLYWNPSADTIYKTDAETTPIDKDADGEAIVRWYPVLKPATAPYWRQLTVAAQWRNAANGINGHPVMQAAAASSGIGLTGVTHTFVTTDLFTATDAVFVAAGRFVDGTATGNFIHDGWPDALQLSRQSGNVARLLFETSGGNRTIDITADAGGLFSVVAWLHDGVIEWWANGVKQTNLTSVANLNTLTRANWLWNGLSTTNIQMLRHGAGKAADATADDMAALAAHLETLLGR